MSGSPQIKPHSIPGERSAELSAGLDPWRKPHAVHDPAKVLTDLALTLALGGDCLADVAVLRAEPGVYGLVASDPTVSRTIDALAKNAPAALKAINAARARARARASELAGPTARFTIDSVASYAKSEFPTSLVNGNTTNRAELRLITCGGAFDRPIGHYDNNVIAFGHLVG